MNKKRDYIVAASTALGLLGVSLAMLSLVDSGYEMTQLRNALIGVPAAQTDLEWTPDGIPEGFHQETGTAPPEFLEAAQQVLASIPEDAGDLDRALALARHLASGPGRGGGIRSNTQDTYKEILSESRGYCSDYTQVLNGLAYAAEIPIREWGMSFDDYSGYGHAFSEVYDRSLQQWVLIDSFYSLYFADRASQKPLSALELQERLSASDQRENIDVHQILPERFAFKSADAALDYYERGTDHFFLYFGNNVFSYDSHPVVSSAGRISRALEESVGIALGIRPKVFIQQTKTNGPSIETLFFRRNLFFALAVLVLILAVALGLQLRRMRWSGR